jgi:hypothetical protein
MIVFSFAKKASGTHNLFCKESIMTIIDGLIKPTVTTNSNNTDMSSKTGDTYNIDLSYRPTFNIHLPPMEEAAVLRMVKELLNAPTPIPQEPAEQS